MLDVLDPNSDKVTIQRVHKGSAVDYKQIKETLSTTVIDTETGEPISDEIEAILDRIRGTHAGDPRYVYYIALVGDAIRGVMGMRRIDGVDDSMRQYASDDHAAEIVNVSVHVNESHHGIGSRLLGALHDEAEAQGVTRLVVTSGPRYAKKGWPFWDKHFGPAKHLIKDMYGPGADAPIWTKKIEKK